MRSDSNNGGRVRRLGSGKTRSSSPAYGVPGIARFFRQVHLALLSSNFIVAAGLPGLLARTRHSASREAMPMSISDWLDAQIGTVADILKLLVVIGSTATIFLLVSARAEEPSERRVAWLERVAGRRR